MSLAFLLKKILSSILLPPLLPILAIVTGLLLLRRYPRGGRWLAWGGVVVSVGFSTPILVNQVLVPLENVPIVAGPQAVAAARAIVILGAGQRRFMPEYNGPTPNRLAIERLRFGARIARSTGLPVLLSGGAPAGYMAESVLMAQALEFDFGVTPTWVEDQSLDTAENATYSAKILAEAGIDHIVLVTHAAHMRRAQREFEHVGLKVIPAPTGFLGDPDMGDRFGDYVPGASASYSAWYACHEWLGLLAQRIRLGSGENL